MTFESNYPLVAKVLNGLDADIVAAQAKVDPKPAYFSALIARSPFISDAPWGDVQSDPCCLIVNDHYLGYNIPLPPIDKALVIEPGLMATEAFDKWKLAQDGYNLEINIGDHFYTNLKRWFYEIFNNSSEIVPVSIYHPQSIVAFLLFGTPLKPLGERFSQQDWNDRGYDGLFSESLYDLTKFTTLVNSMAGNANPDEILINGKVIRIMENFRGRDNNVGEYWHRNQHFMGSWSAIATPGWQFMAQATYSQIFGWLFSKANASLQKLVLDNNWLPRIRLLSYSAAYSNYVWCYALTKRA